MVINMKSTVTLSHDQMNQIFEHCKKDYPYECCGILIGDYETKKVVQVYEAENIRKDRKNDRYQIKPEDQFKADEIAREKDLDVIGFYHSHPDHPNAPSQFDLDMAINAMQFGISFLIVATKEGKETDPKSWILSDEDNQFHEEEIKLV